MTLKEHFLDIFTYQFEINQKLADQLEANENRLDPKFLRLFSHMINAHAVWNARLTGGVAPPVWEEHSLATCRTMDLENFYGTREILENKHKDLDLVIAYKTSRGDDFSNSVREILFHTSNHHSHHRAQIISGLRVAGIEPVVTDYIFYKRQA